MTNFMRDRRDFLTTVATATGGLTLGGSINESSAAAVDDKYLAAAKLGNFNCYYEVHGEGPAIVFAHGGGGNHLSWCQQVPAFSAHFKCITFDHRTFGYSHDVANGPGVKAFVQDLKALLDKLGIQKATLVGQSMGGWTILGFASAYPDRVSGLVMCDTHGGIDDPEIAAVVAKHQEERARAGKTTLLDAVSEGFRKREPVRTFLYREITALTVPKPGENSEVRVAKMAEGLYAIKTDPRPVLAHKIPVLLIVGEEDVLIPPAAIELMHKKMPGSRLVKVPDAGHSAYFEKPDEVNRIILEFLGREARPSA